MEIKYTLYCIYFPEPLYIVYLEDYFFTTEIHRGPFAVILCQGLHDTSITVPVIVPVTLKIIFHHRGHRD